MRDACFEDFHVNSKFHCQCPGVFSNRRQVPKNVAADLADNVGVDLADNLAEDLADKVAEHLAQNVPRDVAARTAPRSFFFSQNIELGGFFPNNLH